MGRTIAWDVVVLGGANTDYLVHASQLPAPGESQQGETFQVASGGKGANQAVAAARVGTRVAFIGRLGSDRRGTALEADLQRAGVDTRAVVRDDRAATGVALVMVDQQGQKQILTAPGANRQLSVADVRKAASLIEEARVLLMQLEAPLDCVQAALEIAHATGAGVVLDPAPAVPLSTELLRLVNVIKPNAHEAEVLTGIHVEDRASASSAADVLLQAGVTAVAIEAGQEGNLLIWREQDERRAAWQPRLPVRSIDATGAGDAFAAALAVMLAEGRPWTEAGSFANAAAALTTTVLGAQAALPTRAAILALLAQTTARERSLGGQEQAG